MRCNICKIGKRLEFDVEILKHCTLCRPCFISVYTKMCNKNHLVCQAGDDCVSLEAGYIPVDCLTGLIPVGGVGVRFTPEGMMRGLRFCPGCVVKPKDDTAEQACGFYNRTQELKKKKRKFERMKDLPLSEREEIVRANMVDVLESIAKKRRQLDEMEIELLKSADKIEANIYRM